MLEVPKVRWCDIGGQEDIKRDLREVVEWPQKHPDAFLNVGVKPQNGALLYGPPGCSKTLLARAVASEAGLNFFAIKGPELFSKWVGESEKAISTLFKRARTSAPSVIFFDEIDGLVGDREGSYEEGVSVGSRVISQILVELDGETLTTILMRHYPRVPNFGYCVEFFLKVGVFAIVLGCYRLETFNGCCGDCCYKSER